MSDQQPYPVVPVPRARAPRLPDWFTPPETDRTSPLGVEQIEGTVFDLTRHPEAVYGAVLIRTATGWEVGIVPASQIVEQGSTVDGEERVALTTIHATGEQIEHLTGDERTVWAALSALVAQAEQDFK